MIPGFYRIPNINIALNELLRILFTRSQAVVPKYRTTAPTVDDLDELEECYVDDGTNRRKYVKLNGTLRYWNLT